MMKRYQAYLLRLWQSDNPESTGWLASLEDPHTRQVVSFSSLERLFEFIQAQTSVPGEGSRADESREKDRYTRG